MPELFAHRPPTGGSTFPRRYGPGESIPAVPSSAAADGTELND
jgi:hypothetical protein